MTMLDFAVLAGIALVTVIIIIWMVRGKKKCKGGCGGCPYRDDCELNNP